MSTKMAISPRVGWRKIGQEIAAFNCETQEIMLLNETATEIWTHIHQDRSLEEIVTLLSQDYDSESLETLCRDLDSLISDLTIRGFLIGDEIDSAPNSKLLMSDENGEQTLLALEMKAIQCMVPFAVTFETTYACNENCVHCYMEKNFPSMPFSLVETVLKELAEAGTLFLSFTGGEFFCRPDALRILESASNLNFVCDVLTNGTLIDNGVAERLSRLKVRRVQISLYGSNSTTHDSITRLEGSFLKTMDGIRALRSRGVKVEVAYPMMRSNFSERYDIREMVFSMGCLLSPTPMISARNDGSEDTFSLRLSDDQVLEFLRDKEFSKLYSGRAAFEDHQFYLGLEDITLAPPCYSGFNTCAITPQGTVLPCNQLLVEVGDLKQSSFAEIWKNSTQLKTLRSMTLRDLPSCIKCKLLRSCSRCPGLALLEGGDISAASPENCRISKLRVL